MNQRKSEQASLAGNITICFETEIYEKLLLNAKKENRSLENFIETVIIENLEEKNFVDEFEMQEIFSNKELLKGLKEGHEDAKSSRGRFVQNI